VFRAKGNGAGPSGLEEWLRLVRLLETLPAHHIVEIPCHPGYVDDELRGHARYAEGRQEEIVVLTSEALKGTLSRAGIRLVTFRDL
jgi:predicted glycoside hydrolase/deacetylase ChbG (UPF0249 family)